MPRPLPPSSKEGFSLPGERAAALCLHGFTGTPYELRVVAEALAEEDVACEAPLLPGHGTVPEDLNHVDAEDWLEHAREALDELPGDGPRFLVGSSMGCLLALILAAERPHEVDGLVLLAPALLAHPSGELALALAARGLSRVTPSIPKAQTGGDIEDAEARERNPCYAELPVGGMGALERLRRLAHKELARVRAPTLVAHGALDRTMAPASADLVTRHVHAPRVERYLFPRSRHVIGLDVERDELCALIGRFVRERLDEEEARRSVPLDGGADEPESGVSS